MNVTMTGARMSWTFEQWLTALVEATPDERRMLAIEGSDAGLALRRVRDDRCGLALNWLSAYNHLDHSETSYRLQNGSAARLHVAGDLQPVRAVSETCRRCGKPVIWTTTQAGNPLPVDADPNPAAGTVLVTAAPAGPARRDRR